LVRAPDNVLLCDEAGALEFLQCEANLKQIVQTRRAQVLHVDPTEHEEYIAFGAQETLLNSLSPKPFSSRAFKKTQIACVIDHPACVGIFPVHAHWPNKADRLRLHQVSRIMLIMHK